jgi:hypothetical protein
MTRLAKIGRWFARFLELRLRAFVYALFAVVGFLLGVIVTTDMAVESLNKLNEATMAMIAKDRGA